MHIEEWRKAPGFPAYSVSSFGRVRRDESRTNSKAGTIIIGRLCRGGYRYFNVTLPDGCRRTVKFHRLVCEAFHGSPPSAKHVVAHNDGDNSNNSASNLRWATSKENHSDRWAHGTEPVGSKNPRSKLDEALVRQIRDAYRAGLGTTYQLADRFGVYPTTIQKLIKGQTWKHVA